MRTKLIKIGNSRGFILPRPLVRSLALEEGDELTVEYRPDAQIIRLTLPPTKQLKLA